MSIFSKARELYEKKIKPTIGLISLGSNLVGKATSAKSEVAKLKNTAVPKNTVGSGLADVVKQGVKGLSYIPQLTKKSNAVGDYVSQILGFNPTQNVRDFTSGKRDLYGEISGLSQAVEKIPNINTQKAINLILGQAKTGALGFSGVRDIPMGFAQAYKGKVSGNKQMEKEGTIKAGVGALELLGSAFRTTGFGQLTTLGENTGFEIIKNLREGKVDPLTVSFKGSARDYFLSDAFNIKDPVVAMVLDIGTNLLLGKAEDKVVKVLQDPVKMDALRKLYEEGKINELNQELAQTWKLRPESGEINFNARVGGEDTSLEPTQRALPGMGGMVPKQNDLSTLDLPSNITRTPDGGVHIEPKYTVSDVTSMIKEATNNGIDVPVAKPYEPKVIQGALDRNVLSIEDFFNKQGAPGKAFSDMYKTARYEGDTLAGKATVDLEKAFKKLSLDERMRFADVAEGKIEADTVPLQRALDVWDTIRKDVADKASDAGLRIKTSDGAIVEFAPRENYYPHYVPEDIVSNAKARKDALTKMVQSGWADNMAEAESKFNRFVLSKIKRRYGNLEKAREVDFPIYEKDPTKVLFNYVDSAYHRIAEAQRFGSGDEKAYRLANEIALNGGDGNLARSMMDRVFGKEDFSPFSKKVSGALTGYQTVTKLGVGAITNIGQSISTSAYTSPVRMAQAMGDALGSNKEDARYFTKLTGEILDSSQRDFVGSFGAEGKIPSKFLQKVGFTASEEFNRVVAANAGRREMEYLGDKLLKDPTNDTLLRSIKKFGVDPQDILNRGSVAQEDLIKAGKNVIDNTQFKTQPFDLPYSWSSPMGKVMTQFKSFAYKQSKFMGSMATNVAKETAKGNLRPLMSALITFGVLAPVAGEVLGDVKAILKNKSRKEEKPLERYLNNLFFTASLGLLEDVGTLATGKYGASGNIGVVAGPTASDAYKLLEAGQSLARDRKTMTGMDEVGARVKPLARMLIRSVPVVGPAIESATIPNTYTRSMIGVNTQAKTEAERVLEKLEKYPVSEQNKMMEELRAGDKALYKKVYTKKMEEVLKITKDEIEIRGLGVENHERALAVLKKLKKMSNSEQVAYIDRLRKLGVVTDSVYKQILEAAQGGALK